MLILRPATPGDEHLVLEWRNEEATRAASFDTAEIAPGEHHRWFTRKLGDPDCALLIVEHDGLPVGQVRLDRITADAAEISIGLAPEARGRGLGREALRQAALEAPKLLHVRNLKARVRPENTASLAAFAAIGFRVVEADKEAVVLLLGSQIDPSTG